MDSERNGGIGAMRDYATLKLTREVERDVLQYACPDRCGSSKLGMTSSGTRD